MAKLIRYCKLKEEHCGDNVFDVSRPNIMGNPFTHIKDRKTKALVKVKTREEAIEKYGKYFNKMLVLDKEFKEEFEKMVNACFNYDEVFFGCYCKMDESCHADVIMEKVRKECRKRMMKKLIEKRDCPSEQ